MAGLLANNIFLMSLNIISCVYTCMHDVPMYAKIITGICTLLWCIVWLMKDVHTESGAGEHICIGICLVMESVGIVYSAYNHITPSIILYSIMAVFLVCIFILSEILLLLPEKDSKKKNKE